MLRQKTVFVIGAGAGFEIGMPLGDELAARISGSLDGSGRVTINLGDRKFEILPEENRSLRDWLQNRSADREACQRAAKKISKGIAFAPSIDVFLDLHKADSTAMHVGKIAIVHSILNAERKSKLAFEEGEKTISTARLVDTWFMRLIRKLAVGAGASPFNLFDQITFITFNYDRTLEHFLGHAVAQLYALPQDEAWAVVKKAKIFHPYGTVGQLPGLYEGSGTAVEFGEVNAPLGELAKGIKTYTEQREEDEVQASMLETIRHAGAIVFLGFGYHQQNLEILRPPGNDPRVRIFGTAKYVSDEDREVLRNQFLSMLQEQSFSPDHSIRLHDMGCKELLDFYHFTL